MAYNPDIERTVLIGINYKDAARKLGKRRRHGLRDQIELLIETACKEEKINIPKLGIDKVSN